MSPTNSSRTDWRERWYEIIFEADTPAGKAFDVILLVAILLSVAVVMLESVPPPEPDQPNAGISAALGPYLVLAEWFFTLLFTVEYIARIAVSPHRWRYIRSFYGIIDLLAILPSYIIFLLAGAEYAQRLTVVRSLRLLRAFRIFKLAHMLSEASALRAAIWASRAKIAVFLAVVIIAVVIVGSAMHLIEGPKNGFTSIPQSMYWAVVTLTTVGYGDIAPQTALGKALAAVIMVLGYSLIIVPTGIVSAELTQVGIKRPTTQVCPQCLAEGHDRDAVHCKYCGGRL